MRSSSGQRSASSHDVEMAAAVIGAVNEHIAHAKPTFNPDWPLLHHGMQSNPRLAYGE
jgi:hypothetical protein